MYFLQESDRKSISCKNLARFLQEFFSVRFLQEMYFLPESSKILARVVFIFNQGSFTVSF